MISHDSRRPLRPHGRFARRQISTTGTTGLGMAWLKKTRLLLNEILGRRWWCHLLEAVFVGACLLPEDSSSEDSSEGLCLSPKALPPERTFGDRALYREHNSLQSVLQRTFPEKRRGTWKGASLGERRRRVDSMEARRRKRLGRRGEEEEAAREKMQVE